MGKNTSNQTQTPDNDATESTPVEPQIFMQLSKDDILELIREARRDPDLEAKTEAEATRIATRRRQMVQIARQDEAAKRARQAACQHKKPNGELCMGGQEFSDGRVRLFCLRCQVTLREYWSPSVAQGMAIARKMETLGITDDDLREAMDVQGVGQPEDDAPNDFALGMPRSVSPASLTTAINR